MHAPWLKVSLDLPSPYTCDLLDDIISLESGDWDAVLGLHPSQGMHEDVQTFMAPTCNNSPVHVMMANIVGGALVTVVTLLSTSSPKKSRVL